MSEVVKSDFTIMDEADNAQIQNADSELQQALAYTDKQHKKQLSFSGIKWIVLKMAEKGQPLDIIDMPVVELVKSVEDDQTTWIWYCTIKVKNLKTQMTTIGASECPYMEFVHNMHKYDAFGRTKAISKAERNAFRKQIPEIEIISMLNDLSPDKVQNPRLSTVATTTNNTTTANTTNNGTKRPASEKQIAYLESLGYAGKDPETIEEAQELISRYTN